MTVVSELTSQFGIAAACQALAVPRSSFYRSRQVTSPKVDPPSPPAHSPRALSEEEQSVVRETLNSPRFVDQAPREVYATLLDEERYICSWRTMYRILERNQEVRERRYQLRHPNHAKPELVATAPNQLWSWDITKLLGPTKGTYYQYTTLSANRHSLLPVREGEREVIEEMLENSPGDHYREFTQKREIALY
jgi:putative transposase